MKKSIQIILMMFSILFITSCSGDTNYGELSEISRVSISEGSQYNDPIGSFNIEIENKDRLNKIKHYVNEAKKYRKDGSSDSVFNHYIIEIDFNDEDSLELSFYFPENLNESSIFFYPVDYENDVYSIPREYSEKLYEAFFTYGQIDKLKKVQITSKDNYDRNSSNYFFTLDDESKLDSLSKIMAHSILKYSPKEKDTINYIMEASFIDKNKKMNPIILSIPEKNAPISFYHLGYENMTYWVDENFSIIIKDILFDR